MKKQSYDSLFETPNPKKDLPEPIKLFDCPLCGKEKSTQYSPARHIYFCMKCMREFKKNNQLFSK